MLGMLVVYMHIHNAKPQCLCRFLRHNLLLAGLWYGEKKPTMTSFLTPFTKEINRLSKDGVFNDVCVLAGKIYISYIPSRV